MGGGNYGVKGKNKSNTVYYEPEVYVRSQRINEPFYKKNKSRWGLNFPHPSRPSLAPTQPPIHWVPGIYRGKSDWGVALTTHPI
jgi:hypothetical protein